MIRPESGDQARPKNDELKRYSDAVLSITGQAIEDVVWSLKLHSELYERFVVDCEGEQVSEITDSMLLLHNAFTALRSIQKMPKEWGIE